MRRSRERNILSIFGGRNKRYDIKYEWIYSITLYLYHKIIKFIWARFVRSSKPLLLRHIQANDVDFWKGCHVFWTSHGSCFPMFIMCAALPVVLLIDNNILVDCFVLTKSSDYHLIWVVNYLRTNLIGKSSDQCWHVWEENTMYNLNQCNQ